jgi:hypothetical protein
VFKYEEEAGGPGICPIVYTILIGSPASKRQFWRPTGRWRNSTKTDFILWIGFVWLRIVTGGGLL